MWKFLVNKWPKLEGLTGLVVSGPGLGSGTIEGGVGAIVLSSIIGAFLGLIGGLILSHLCRFMTMIFNRPLGGNSWVVVGAVTGAVLFAVLAINSDDN